MLALLFNSLSRFVVAFSSKWQVSFNFMAAVTVCSDFGAQENKNCYCFHFSPSICHEVMGLDVIILVSETPWLDLNYLFIINQTRKLLRKRLHLNPFKYI